MRNNRFEIRYYYNGELLDKATRFFDANLSYPKQVFGDGNVDYVTDALFQNSVESVLLGDEIEKLILKILKHDTENYLYRSHTNSIYHAGDSFGGTFAKEGDLSIPERTLGNKLTFEIVDTESPVYRDGNKVRGSFENRVLLSREMNVDNYFIDINYPPNFWMVFSNYSDESFENNKKISGENLGILSAIFYFFSAKRFTNRFTLNQKQALILQKAA